jgi:catechol 2,3-dioxygenase-like lactoylglutathione lyase family enzyme
MAVELDELVVGDEPEAWEAAGFAVDPDGTVRVGQVRIRLAGREGGKRIRSWVLRGAPADLASVDGLATATSDRPVCEPAEHPNGAVAIDHVVALTPDTARTVAAFTALGVEVRRTREVDEAQYGFPAVQTFFRVGEPILELLGPIEPSGDGPAGFFGLAYTVADLDALPGRFGEGLGRVKDAVQPGRRIATLRNKQYGLSVATAFMSA